MTNLIDLTVLEAARGLRSGDFSSRELTKAFLDQIDRLDGDLHAFLTLTPELALQQAEKADAALAAWRKDPSSPLPAMIGIPIAVKDVLCVAGVPCTCGSRILEGFRPPFNATAVERLLARGMVILGKTNTD